MILSWTVLRPSARERRLWRGTVATAVVISAALATAGLLADPRRPVSVWSAAIVSATAAVWTALASKRAGARRFEVAINADGDLLARPVASNPELQQLSRNVFVASWLITLRCGATFIPIWPDSVDADAFRRLLACARWAGVEGRADGSESPEQRLTGNPR